MMEKKIIRSQQNSIGFLPSDLLFQVLSRLPPKTLFRLRCVSKQWCDFISDPFFVNLHSNESKKKPLRVGVYHTRGSSRFKVTLIDPLDTSSAEKFWLSLASDDYSTTYCSGLLLFYGARQYVHVCNPSTREVFTINRNSLYKNQPSSPTQYAFTRYKDILVGFGFLPSKSQYKILDLFAMRNEHNLYQIKTKALILTLPSKNSAASWKYIPVNYSDYVKYCPVGKIICVNGIMYWRTGHYVNLGDMVLGKILTFDLEAEEFLEITCPGRHYRELDLCAFLVELKGAVCMVEVLRHEPVAEIWVLKNWKNSIWAKEYTINYSYELPRTMFPLQIIVDDGGEKAILIELGYRSFYYYNLKEKTFAKLGEYENLFRHEFIHYGSLPPDSSCGLVIPTTQ